MDELKFSNQQLTIMDEEGNETLCQILFTFESEEFGKKYVLFYPISTEAEDDNGEIAVMAASYTEEDGGIGELHEITSDEEWEFIEDVLGQYEDSLDDENDEDCDCEECDCDYDDDEDDDDEDDDDCEGCGCHHHK